MNLGAKSIDEDLQKQLKNIWSVMDGKQIRAAIESTLDSLLDGSENKSKKIELLQKNVLNDQKVKKLTTDNWIKVLDTLDLYTHVTNDKAKTEMNKLEDLYEAII